MPGQDRQPDGGTSYAHLAGSQVQLSTENASFNMPGQITWQRGYHSYPIAHSTATQPWPADVPNLMHNPIGPPMQVVASTISDQQHWPPHNSRSAQQLGGSMPSSDALGANQWQQANISDSSGASRPHTIESTTTGFSRPQEFPNTTQHAPRSSAPLVVPLITQQYQQAQAHDNDNSTMPQSIIPHPPQPQRQPEQAQSAATILATREPKPDPEAPSMSENERLRRQETHSRRQELSALRVAFANFEGDLMSWIEALGPTRQDELKEAIAPALRAMKSGLENAAKLLS